MALLYLFVLSATLLALWFLVFLIVAEIAWRLVPRITKRPLDYKKRRFTIVVVGCLAFLVFGGWFINTRLLPGKFHPLSLVGNTVTLLYVIFCGWTLLRSQRKSGVFGGTVAFALIVSLVALLGNVTVSSNTADTPQDLSSLPYITWSALNDSVHESGVTAYEDERVFQGINVYASRVSMQTMIMNMSGDILHTWTYLDVFKENNLRHSIEICENGDLLISAADRMLVRLDWHSNVKWKIATRVHHDIAVADDGNILALGRKDALCLLKGIPVPVLADYIFIYSPDGELEKEISLLKLLKDHVRRAQVNDICRWVTVPKTLGRSIDTMNRNGYVCREGTSTDIFHSNALEIIDRDVDGLCKRGNVLLSVRELDLIGILDLETEEFVWTWGPGEISRQHQPTLLDNGNILLFDNGVGRGFSRIVEIDPVARTVLWTYEAKPPETFYSARMGSSQRLPNGNTLITNSESGHVFEITEDNEVIWEYYNPEISKDGESRAIIYRMRRITDLDKYAFPYELKGH